MSTSATLSVSSSSHAPSGSSSSVPPSGGRRHNRSRGKPVSGKTPSPQRDLNKTKKRESYVDKSDRLRPPSGRGSSGFTLEKPLPPEFEGDETFCCDADGRIIAMRIEVQGRHRWKDFMGRFCKERTYEEWRVHTIDGKNKWLERKMTH